MTVLFFITIFISYLFLTKAESLIKKIFISIFLFLAFNSAILILFWIFNLRINLNLILLGHFLFIIFTFLKKEKITFQNKLISSKIAYGEIAIIFLVLILFLSSWLRFENGLRLPVIAKSQDGSNHYSFYNFIILNQKIEGSYPSGFHSNGAFLYLLIDDFFNSFLKQSILHDTVFKVNFFSLWIWLNLMLYSIAFYYIINYFVSCIHKENEIIKNNISYYFFEGTISFFTSFLIAGNFIASGFLSNFFSLIFFLFLIYSILLKKNNYINLIIALGFLFSYHYFLPILLIFFTLILLTKKIRREGYNKKIVVLSLLLTILYGIVYLIKSSNFTKLSIDRLVFLTHQFGGIHLFSDNLIVFFFCFLILLAIFGDNEEKNFLYNSYVSLMWVSTIIFSAILLTANLVLIGQPRYAFWKSFYLMIIMLIIYGLVSFILVVLKYLFKRFKMFDLSVFFCDSFNHCHFFLYQKQRGVLSMVHQRR